MVVLLMDEYILMKESEVFVWSSDGCAGNTVTTNAILRQDLSRLL